MEKFTDFLKSLNPKTKQLKNEINTLKARKLELQATISELTNAIENPETTHKWFEVKAKLSEKKDIRSELKSAESELKDIGKKLPKLEKSYSKQVAKAKNERIGIVAVIVVVIFIVVAIIIGSISENKSENKTDTFKNTEISDMEDVSHITEIEKTTFETTTTTTTTATTKKTEESTDENFGYNEETEAEIIEKSIVEQENYSSETVYITDSGTKYHLDGCRYLKTKHAISKKEAIRQGYEPCGVCRP